MKKAVVKKATLESSAEKEPLPLEKQMWRLPRIPYDCPESPPGIGDCGDDLVSMFRQLYWHDLDRYFLELRARVTKTEGDSGREVLQAEYLEAVAHLRDLGLAAARLLEEVRQRDQETVEGILRKATHLPVYVHLQKGDGRKKKPPLFINGIQRGSFANILIKNIKLPTQPTRKIETTPRSRKRPKGSILSEDAVNPDMTEAYGKRVVVCLDGVRIAYRDSNITPCTSLGRKIANLSDTFEEGDWCDVAEEWLKTVVFIAIPEDRLAFERQVNLSKGYVHHESQIWHYIFRERIEPGIKRELKTRKNSGVST
ncbi:MAG: hypothetical protein SFU53_00460 [Terrimicrobiaceae bacterium]|nr:hypothetical protein [Terrimicrobiaceae bacterium]